MSTRAKVIDLLQNSWKMRDVELELQADREKFLNKLILVIHERVPFHFLSMDKFRHFLPKGQITPNFKEIDKVCISGEGGTCGVLNTFTWGVLKVLGYSAHLWGSTVKHPNDIFTHLLIIVKDLVNTGDFHLVECGAGLPTFEAVSLKFDKESQVFNHSYLEYKFIKHDGKILRMHGNGDVVKRNDIPVEGFDFMQGHWRCFYEFTLEDFGRKPLSLDPYFDEKCGPKKVIPKAAIFPRGKAVRIVGYNLFIEQEDRTLKKIATLKSNEEILQVYKDYFPFIDENIVQDAYLK